MRISLQQAADFLTTGHVVAVPTETVYGLAASLAHPKAMEALFALKGRPKQNPLIIHLAEADYLSSFIEYKPLKFNELTNTFWPGPMTLVLKVMAGTIPDLARAGLPTAAFRVPSHPLVQELLHKTGPLVMPSANLSGRPSATHADHVESDFGADFPVLEGRVPLRGVESTVLMEQQSRWEIIRLGAISASAFEPILGYIPSVAAMKAGETPLCPGQLYRHYAPTARLIPTLTFSEPFEGVVVGFSDRRYPKGASLFALGSSHNPDEVAENLYATLRRLDSEGVTVAWLDLRFPRDHLWATIAERLLKACRS